MKTLITILALLGVLFIIGCTESGSEPVTGAAVSEIQTQQNAEDSKAQTTQIIGAIVDVTIEDKSSEEEAIVSEITNKEAVEKQLGDAEHASSQQILKEICTPNALVRWWGKNPAG